MRIHRMHEMNIRGWITVLTALTLSAVCDAREAKELDNDVIYDESRIPLYELPPVLLSSEGKRIATPEQWRTVRRPQILSLFSNVIYGCVPDPESPIETEYDILRVDKGFMGGKVTLWTAVRDERFALAISAQSGCAGAALWRRRSGETLEKMVTRFPYWLCRNAWKFVNQEDDLPVDQHMLLALIAPRPVYVASGIDDTWADPRGEYASAYHASEVYRLLGKKGLTSEELPALGQAILDGHVGYHVREGGHSVERFDWRRFMDFADRHLKSD